MCASISEILRQLSLSQLFEKKNFGVEFVNDKETKSYTVQNQTNKNILRKVPSDPVHKAPTIDQFHAISTANTSNNLINGFQNTNSFEIIDN